MKNPRLLHGLVGGGCGTGQTAEREAAVARPAGVARPFDYLTTGKQARDSLKNLRRILGRKVVQHLDALGTQHDAVQQVVFGLLGKLALELVDEVVVGIGGAVVMQRLPCALTIMPW